VDASLIPIFYAASMAVGGAGSVTFGRWLDRHGIVVLVPLTLVAAAYAPLVFLGGSSASLVGACLWGMGIGVHESILPAAIAPMVARTRRASAYGLFTGAYGIAWFLGSSAIGALFGVSLGVVVAFAVLAELAAAALLTVVALDSHPER
jgi:MFS family permease